MGLFGWFRKAAGLSKFVPEEVTQESISRRLVHFTKENGWGDAIRFMEWEPDQNGHRRIYGHKGRIEVGDWFAQEMKSGRIGILEIVELEWKSDPPDMFFGKACDVGFLPDGIELQFRPIGPKFVPLGSSY